MQQTDTGWATAAGGPHTYLWVQPVVKGSVGEVWVDQTVLVLIRETVHQLHYVWMLIPGTHQHMLDKPYQAKQRQALGEWELELTCDEPPFLSWRHPTASSRSRRLSGQWQIRNHLANLKYSEAHCTVSYNYIVYKVKHASIYRMSKENIRQRRKKRKLIIHLHQIGFVWSDQSLAT